MPRTDREGAVTLFKNRSWLQSLPLPALLTIAVALWVKSPLQAVLSQGSAAPCAMVLAAAQAGATQQATAGAQSQAALVTASVVWKPDAAVLKATDQVCGGTDPSKYSTCFIERMQAGGASPEAVGFAQDLAAHNSRGLGYALDFTEGGKVAVAHVVFPSRSQRKDRPSQAWLLLNGSPRIVDVDDLALLPGPSLEGDLILQEIRRSYSKASVYGDERTAASPAMMLRPDGGQRFPITYSLRNGCQSCEEVGNAEIAFDFSADRKFKGATLLGLWMRKDMGTLVTVPAGRDFYLHMLSNHSAGYAWQLVSPLDENLLKFVGKDYSEPGGQFGKDGIEKWTLHALAPGRTILRFENVRAGETNPPPDGKFFFAVTVQ